MSGNTSCAHARAASPSSSLAMVMIMLQLVCFFNVNAAATISVPTAAYSSQAEEATSMPATVHSWQAEEPASPASPSSSSVRRRSLLTSSAAAAAYPNSILSNQEQQSIVHCRGACEHPDYQPSAKYFKIEFRDESSGQTYRLVVKHGSHFEIKHREAWELELVPLDIGVGVTSDDWCINQQFGQAGAGYVGPIHFYDTITQQCTDLVLDANTMRAPDSPVGADVKAIHKGKWRSNSRSGRARAREPMLYEMDGEYHINQEWTIHAMELRTDARAGNARAGTVYSVATKLGWQSVAGEKRVMRKFPLVFGHHWLIAPGQAAAAGTGTPPMPFVGQQQLRPPLAAGRSRYPILLDSQRMYQTMVAAPNSAHAVLMNRLNQLQVIQHYGIEQWKRAQLPCQPKNDVEQFQCDQKR